MEDFELQKVFGLKVQFIISRDQSVIVWGVCMYGKLCKFRFIKLDKDKPKWITFSLCTTMCGSCIGIHGPWVRIIHYPHPSQNLNKSQIVQDCIRMMYERTLITHTHTWRLYIHNTNFTFLKFFLPCTLMYVYTQIPHSMHHALA